MLRESWPNVPVYYEVSKLQTLSSRSWREPLKHDRQHRSGCTKFTHPCGDITIVFLAHCARGSKLELDPKGWINWGSLKITVPGREFLSDAHFLDLVSERKSMIHNTHAWRGGAWREHVWCKGYISSAFGGNYMIRPRRWLSATESRSSTCSPVLLLLLLASNSTLWWQPAARARGDIGCRESHCNGGEGSGGDQRPTLWRSNGNCTASECHC